MWRLDEMNTTKMTPDEEEFNHLGLSRCFFSTIPVNFDGFWPLLTCQFLVRMLLRTPFAVMKHFPAVVNRMLPDLSVQVGRLSRIFPSSFKDFIQSFSIPLDSFSNNFFSISKSFLKGFFRISGASALVESGIWLDASRLSLNSNFN